jgi:hypothetical protein
MSLSICPMVQLLYRFYVGNENIKQMSKTEASCKINYYFSKTCNQIATIGIIIL